MSVEKSFEIRTDELLEEIQEETEKSLEKIKKYEKNPEKQIEIALKMMDKVSKIDKKISAGFEREMLRDEKELLRQLGEDDSFWRLLLRRIIKKIK